ncbi:MAG: tyrosine-type recombinase/integrase [Candidatus Aminicenantaceae bacterium]
MAYKWGKAQEAESHYGESRSTLDRWAEKGIIRKSKVGGTVEYELIPLDIFLGRNVEKHPEPRIRPRGRKQILDISLQDYIKGNLKGDDSAMSTKKGRWNFGRKGVWRRKGKKGNTWYYWYYDENPKPKYVRVPHATCLEDTIIEMDFAVERFRQKKLKHKYITFREFAPIFMDKYASKKRSRRMYRSYIEGRLVPYFGDMLLVEITPEHVSDFVVSFKPKVEHIEEAKGNTVNRHLEVLSRMYTVAEKFGYETGENPVVRELHFADEAQYRRTRTLNKEEEDCLMNEAAPHLRPIIQCMLLQGMRPQAEILGLKISDLDLESQIPTLTIRPEINKTGKLDIIPIRAKIVQMFKQLIAKNGGRSEYVFNYENPYTGEYGNINTFRRAFLGACKRADIEGLQPRDLRRTCATRLHEAGVDELIIKRFLRHSSSDITNTVYIQSSLKLIKQALDEADNVSDTDLLLRQFATNLRQKHNMPNGEKEVTCLFSMN